MLTRKDARRSFARSPGRKGNMHITRDGQMPVPVRNMNQPMPPSRQALRMPGLAHGMTTRRMVSHRVAPSA